jgi:ribosomal RNA-processing protein 1
VHRFLRAFWITIGRDFHSLDRLRLDKYLFLVRCYVGVAFEIFVKGAQQNAAQNKGGDKKRKREEAGQKAKKRSKGKKQSEEREDEEEGQQNDETKWAGLESYISIMEEGPLCPLNFDPDQPPADEKNDYIPMPHGPDGLRYHVMDIWIDELEKVLEFEEVGGDDDETKTRKPKGDVPIELILRPIEKLRAESPYKPVRTRAQEALDDERLIEWGFRTRKVDSDESDESDEEWGGFD